MTNSKDMISPAYPPQKIVYHIIMYPGGIIQ